ncbi:MAG: hypothetical protein K4305_10445 [Chlorobium sp.]|uniref:hypothetical protein n=1 Tax=Chlorobium sp. TaxID=1095 RepID=UPI002F424BB8
MKARKNWISDKEQLSVSTQCELAGVTRSGYYGQSKSLMPNTEDLELMKLQVDQAEPENQVIPRHQPERRIDADLGGHVLLPAGIVHQIPD